MSTMRSRIRTSINNPALQAGLLVAWFLPMALVYPWPNVWPLAHVALVPLLILGIRGEPLRRLTIILIIGCSLWWLLMLGWIRHVTWPGWLGMSLILGPMMAVTVLLVRSLRHRLPLPFTLLVPVVWVGMEYLRGVLLSGFPWFLLGHSQPTWAIQIADIAGAYGVSFVVAMTNGLLLDLLLTPLTQSTGRGRRVSRSVKIAVILWLGVWVFVLGYGIHRVRQTDAILENSPSLRVLVLQPNVPQSNKDAPDWKTRQEFFMEMYRRTLDGVRNQPEDQPAQLVLWSETMVPAALNDEAVRYSDASRVYRTDMTRGARNIGVPMVVGAHAELDFEPHTLPNGSEYMIPARRYNAAYLFGPDGSLVDRYEKIHRVPFGEYMPIVGRFAWTRSLFLRFTPYEHDYSLTAGQEYDVFRLQTPDGRIWRVSTPICYEDVIPYVPRRMVYDGGEKRVDILLNLTNDGWFAGTAEQPQHKQIARFRCVENRVPMARSVNTGISGFIDSAGRIDRERKIERKRWGVTTKPMHADPRTTIYGWWGDFWAGLCFYGTLVVWVAGRVLPTLTRGMRGHGH